MKSAIAPVLLAAVAIVQALGRYVYHRDTIVVVGELFFPIFLAGLTIVYGRRATEGKFSTVRLGLGILAVLTAALTAAGWGMSLFWFYPSIWVYYAAFLLLVIGAVVAVASVPSARKQAAANADRQGDDQADDTRESLNPEEGAHGAGVPSGAEPAAGPDGGWRTSGR